MTTAPDGQKYHLVIVTDIMEQQLVEQQFQRKAGNQTAPFSVPAIRVFTEK